MSIQEIPQGELDQFQTLVAIVERLRAPGGCPWDREQTHTSLKRNLLEECYEVLEAIDDEDPQLLAEELGDLLVQVAFHADIAWEAGQFDLGDVLTKINQKLIRRHPHVFESATVGDAREVERNWEKLKEAERQEKGIKKSPVDGIPKDLPANSNKNITNAISGPETYQGQVSYIKSILTKIFYCITKIIHSYFICI